MIHPPAEQLQAEPAREPTYFWLGFAAGAFLVAFWTGFGLYLAGWWG